MVKIMKVLFLLIIVVLALYIGLRRTEHKMLYYPLQYPEGDWDPDWFPGVLEDCFITTSDEVTLHGWFVRLTPETPEELPYTLLFFHGNAGNITHRLENVAHLVQAGLQVFIFDYRGYGRSPGHPSEQGLYRDGLAAYDFLLSREDVDSEKIILFGRSLGGAVAVEIATHRPCDKLILESTFTSAKEMAHILFGNVPVEMLVQSHFDSLAKIVALHMPLLMIHGTEDEVVPFAQGQRLFAAANDPKAWYVLDGAGHNDTYVVGGQEYFTRLFRFIQTAR